jgi:predicted restriction endonuclease
VLDVLEAAHITPYLGPDTNHVSNGLLLRADIHTLFDLRLIRIHPDTLQVELSDSLKGTPYEEHKGRTLHPTTKQNQRPSPLALKRQYELDDE